MLKSHCLLRVESKFGDPLPSFRIYVKHYLICWSAGRKGGVCLCFQWLLKTGHSVWCRLRGQMLLYAPSSFLSSACTIHQWHKASGAVMPEESEKGCLWNHFPLYLTHNWTGLISCQNKYGGCISLVIKNVLWKSEKNTWMCWYHSTRGQSSVC